MKSPTLEQVLAYKNPAVLKLYKQNYPGNMLSAEKAFEETLKYLWLMHKHMQDYKNNPQDESLPRDLIMLRSMREIDEMWHEFILFTQDYMDFCETYFGEYLHHLPNVFDNAPSSREEVDREVAKILPYVYDNLGESTLRTWYAAYL